MSLIMIPVMMFVAMALVAVSLYAIPIAIATGLTVIAAAVAWRYWYTKGFWETAGKFITLTIIVLVIEGNVVVYSVKHMLREDAAAAPSCDALKNQTKLVMDDSTQVDRVKKALELGLTARSRECQLEVQAAAMARIGSSNASEEYSSTDIERAWLYFIQGNHNPDKCDNDIYVALQLRRAGISGVLETIQAFPKDRFWCNSRENYISQVKQRCASVWQGQCATTLPREALQQMVNNPQMGPMGSELPDLIEAVWRKHQ